MFRNQSSKMIIRQGRFLRLTIPTRERRFCRVGKKEQKQNILLPYLRLMMKLRNRFEQAILATEKA